MFNKILALKYSQMVVQPQILIPVVVSALPNPNRMTYRRTAFIMSSKFSSVLHLYFALTKLIPTQINSSFSSEVRLSSLLNSKVPSC